LTNWGSSAFQIVSSLIGSGLTLFVLTHLVTDFNEPNINLQVYQSVLGDNQIISKILATNDGRAAATQVLLTVYYPAANIVNYSSPFHSENMTLLQQKPNLLVAKLDRLTKDATITINIMAASLDKGLGFNNNSYIVSASYDQGSNIISTTGSPSDNPSFVPSRIQALVFASVLSTVFFIIALYYKKIKNFIKKLERSTYVISIIREMASIQNEIKNDIISKRIFTSEIWDSKDDKMRRQIFRNYEDYNKIDEFYIGLNKRDSVLSQKNISNDLIKEYNKSCLWLAIHVLKNIDWTRYLDIGHKRTRVVLTILAIILASFFIFTVSEIFRLYFFIPSTGIYDILSGTIRSIVTFFLAIEIINFYWSYDYKVDPKNNDIVLNIALPTYRLTKLFIFIILIMGVSIGYIIRESHIQPSSSFAYEYFGLLLISYIARMLILIFIIPRFLLKRYIIKIKEIDQSNTTIGESNFGKGTLHNEQQQEEQHLPQQDDYSYNHNNEESSRLKQVDDDNNKDDYNKNKSQEKHNSKLVDTLNELERLADLRKNGIITEEEFQMLKTNLFTNT
jgi:hypothetical protein